MIPALWVMKNRKLEVPLGDTASFLSISIAFDPSLIEDLHVSSALGGCDVHGKEGWKTLPRIYQLP
jgi:hypothetical protein